MKTSGLLWCLGSGILATGLTVLLPMGAPLIGRSAMVAWLLAPLAMWLATLATVLRRDNLRAKAIGSLLYWCSYAASAWVVVAFAAAASRA